MQIVYWQPKGFASDGEPQAILKLDSVRFGTERNRSHLLSGPPKKIAKPDGLGDQVLALNFAPTKAPCRNEDREPKSLELVTYINLRGGFLGVEGN